MTNERLSNLALLSIEAKRAEAVDREVFVDEFDARHDNRRINYADINKGHKIFSTYFRPVFSVDDYCTVTFSLD